MVQLCPTPTPKPVLTPDGLVRGLEQLPSVPTVLSQLLRLLESESSTTEDVIELVRMDTAIAARVLRVGRSVFYSTRDNICESVDEAVYRIGFDQVHKLVSYAAVSHLLLRQLDSYGIGSEEMLCRSVSCALGAEQLAEHASVNRGVAYTAGLLHGLGLVAIDLWAKQESPGLRFGSAGLPSETCEAETKVLGFDNAAVASSMVRLWQFPPSLVDPISCQYNPRQARDEPLLACILHAAKWLRDAAHLPDDAELPAMPASWILETLSLDSEALEVRLYAVRTAYAEATRLFRAC